MTVSAAAVRAAIVVLAAAAIVAVPHAGAAVYAFAALGTVLAVARPAYAGALVVALAALIGWVVAYGTDVTPPIGRAIAFALALYLLHAAVALAASVPVRASISSAVVVAWARRCLPGVAAAVSAAAVLVLIGRPAGSLALDVVGLSAVLAAVGALVWLTRARH
jgi:hypothetical protein